MAKDLTNGELTRRLEAIERRVTDVSNRVHNNANAITAANLSIGFLQKEQVNMADKEDVLRIEAGLTSLQDTVTKAAVGVAGSALILAVSILATVFT